MTCTVTNNTEDGTIDIVDEVTGDEFAYITSKVKKVEGSFVSGKFSDSATAYGKGHVRLFLVDNINGVEIIEPSRLVDIVICNQFTTLGVTNQSGWTGDQAGVTQAIADIKSWAGLS